MTDQSHIDDAWEYRRLIDRLLLDAISNTTSFAALLPAMKGAGPADVVLGLRRLRQREGLQFPADALILDALQQAGRLPGIDQPAALPLPHPLDSEWRFAASTVDELIGRLLGATSAGDELLLVGTPSVAAALSRTDVDRRIRFVGPADLVTAAVENLFASDPRLVREGGGGAAAAVVDPPWYGGIFAEMLAVCARGCRPFAPVLAAMPRIATRPAMGDAVAQMLSSAAALGLVRADVDPFEVRYRLPLFEACALERSGLHPNLGEWRRGDLITLTASGKVLGPMQHPAREEYVELMLDGCRIRLTLGTPQDSPSLWPVEDEEVSMSVSARSPTRQFANLWTTTNRAFKVDERSCLAAFASIAMDAGMVLPPGLTGHWIGPGRRNGVEAQVKLIHSLYELFARETADASRLVGDGSWLRGAKGMQCLSAWSGMSRLDRCGTTASASSSTAIRAA